MKKSISAILVAALMLFAFTACEQPGINLPANVDYITLVQTGDFLVGDKFDASKFAVYAHDTNGGSTLIQGANVTCATLDKDTVSADTTYTAEATLYVSSKDNGELKANCNFVGYEVESVQITGAPELVVYKGGIDDASGTVVVKADGTADTASDYADASYTLVYNGGSTREVSYKDFGKYVAFEALVTQNVTEVAVGTEYPVWIRTSAEPAEYVATNLKATGVEKAPVAPSNPDPVQTGLSNTVSEKNYLGQNTNVKIYQTFSNDDPEEVTDLSKYVIVETSAGNKVVSTIPTAFDTSAHTYRVTSPDNNALYTVVTIPAGQNYYKDASKTATDITISPVALADGETYKYGQAISGSNVSVTIAPFNTEKATDNTSLKYPVADRIVSVELVGVSNIPSKEALAGKNSFTASCRVVFTSMGVEKTATKDVTFATLSE